MSAGAGAAAAAGAAARLRALGASGVLVRVLPEEFLRVVSRTSAPLVVHARGGIFSPTYQYLTIYKGLAFHTATPTPLELPHDAEVVEARSLWTPN